MELTREKVLAMVEGKELDRLVAERIMGWQMYHYNKDVPSRCYYMLVDENWDAVADDVPFTLQNGERKTEEEAWNDNKSFSTEISAAWEVLEKLVDNGFTVGASKYAENNLYYAHVLKNGVDICDVQMMSSAPEAICKAALLTTITKQEDNQ